MTRSDIYKKIRVGVREYRSSRPAWHKKGVSEWLLVLIQTNTASVIQGNWGWQAREHYFYKLLSVAVLCMDDNGVVRVGPYYPSDRLIPDAEHAFDHVLFEIDRGCSQWSGKSATDLAMMISYHLNRAIESQPTQRINAHTLEEIRNVASLAVLGLEIKTINGDPNAEAN